VSSLGGVRRVVCSGCSFLVASWGLVGWERREGVRKKVTKMTKGESFSIGKVFATISD